MGVPWDSEQGRKIARAAGVTPPARAAGRAKYGNRKVEVLGHTFDSAKEAARYGVLLGEQKAGLIEGLEVQVSFDLVVNGITVARYVADFVYRRAGVKVVEDVKGYRTAVYKLKKKLLKACLGIEITEV